MTILDAIILAIIQGLTEFLPVSSSGHLVLGEALLGGDRFVDSIAFEVVLHLGTFLAVIIVFWKDIAHLLTVLVQNLLHPTGLVANTRDDADMRLIMLMILGMLPAGLVGILWRDEITRAFDSPILVAYTLSFTGLMLLGTRFVKPASREINFRNALLIGIAQALALLPGISRSGSTISTALYLGVPQAKAARFSFIMVLPLILAATGLELIELMQTGISGSDLGILTIGFVVSFFTGWLSLRWLLALLQKGKFHHFAWYCFTIAIITFITLL
jgi:undecaprenyl-diphosphatase